MSTHCLGQLCIQFEYLELAVDVWKLSAICYAQQTAQWYALYTKNYSPVSNTKWLQLMAQNIQLYQDEFLPPKTKGCTLGAMSK